MRAENRPDHHLLGRATMLGRASAPSGGRFVTRSTHGDNHTRAGLRTDGKPSSAGDTTGDGQTNAPKGRFLSRWRRVERAFLWVDALTRAIICWVETAKRTKSNPPEGANSPPWSPADAYSCGLADQPDPITCWGRTLVMVSAPRKRLNASCPTRPGRTRTCADPKAHPEPQLDSRCLARCGTGGGHRSKVAVLFVDFPDASARVIFHPRRRLLLGLPYMQRSILEDGQLRPVQTSFRALCTGG